MSRKQIYEQQQQATLKKWQAEIDKLQAKASEASAGAKLEFRKQIEQLGAKRAAAESKLEELRRASEDKWEGMKGGVESAFKDVSDRVKAAASHFK